jgi:transposase
VERIPRLFFPNEFKEEAAKLVTEGGLGITETRRRLSLAEPTLRNRIKRQQAGRTVPAGRTVSEVEAEVTKLRRELAEAKLEREILKRQ